MWVVVCRAKKPRNAAWPTIFLAAALATSAFAGDVATDLDRVQQSLEEARKSQQELSGRIDAITSKLSAPAPKSEPLVFNRDILPLFVKSCFACHGPDDAKRKAGLRLDDDSVVYKKFDSGKTPLVPRDRAQSEMYQRITASDAGHRMPPPNSGKSLSPEEIERIGRWIDDGAAWEQHWAFKPLAPGNLPEVRDTSWPRNEIDNYVLAKLEAAGLSPSREADRRTLIRRLSFDLLGLPPAPEEVDAFLNDPSPQAYEALVDRLLASPRYGERWARHWLDIVHYGDTHGYDKDKRRPNAWPYRDYVINSLNSDKPYGQFVLEQIAGDVLFPGDPDAAIAPAFIAAGPWDFVGHVELREGTVDKKLTRLLDRDDMVMNTMTTFVSMTVHCARCHHHKFDPIAQDEYYGLQADFAGVDRAERPIDKDPAVYGQRLALMSERKTQATRMVAIQAEFAGKKNDAIDELDKNIAVLKEQLSKIKPEAPEREAAETALKEAQAHREKEMDALAGAALCAERDEVQQRLDDLSKQIEALPAPRMAYVAANDFNSDGSFTPAGVPRSIHVLRRGDINQEAEEAVPGALACVRSLEGRFPLKNPNDEGERRAALAKWIADKRNPLTWRSIVNRVWQFHFGKGIVDTPSDFGHMGSYPTHPELLDWLANAFLEQGQSLKWLHKSIVTSAAYRQVSTDNDEGLRVDAGNTLLWRMNRRQLEAESLRDSVLTLSGKLDLTMGGPGYDLFVFKDDHSPGYFYDKFDVDDPQSFRRSIYRFIVRSVPDPFMETLDCADPSQNVPVRNTTLTALQALALFNDPFVLHQSQFFAERVQTIAPDLPAQVAVAWRLAFCREPSETERDMLVAYAQKHGLASACRVILNSNEFLFID